MNVLVIPENFRKDQYILKPIITRMMTSIGKPRAKVRICTDPPLSGVSQALKWDTIKEIIQRYGTVNLFLLCIDRDGDTNRQAALDSIEQQAAAMEGLASRGRAFFAEHAHQELEVWILAGFHDLPPDWEWRAVRSEIKPKECYFQPMAAARGLRVDKSGRVSEAGYQRLAEEACNNYRRIRQLCPEDVGHLEDRLRVWVAA